VAFAVFENNNDTYGYLEVFARDTCARAYVLFPESEADSGDDLPRGCTALALSPDGALLAAASVEFGVGVWELATGRRVDGPLGATELPALQRELRFTRDLAFTPDGCRLVILTDDERRVLEYDVATRRCLDLGAITPSGRGPRAAFDAGHFRLALAPGGETAVCMGLRGTYVFPVRGPRHGRFVPAPRVRRCMPVHLDADRMSALWVSIASGQAGALVRQDLTTGRVHTIRWTPTEREGQALPPTVRDLIRDFPEALSPDGTRVARVDGECVTVRRIRPSARSLRAVGRRRAR
jgi:WD40 repeat protein